MFVVVSKGLTNTGGYAGELKGMGFVLQFKSDTYVDLQLVNIVLLFRR